ncbi:hypothetical protein NN3_23270 [Nocardia neocaledoniensis NBRC 108232]|nr:hypothetical protein NN3_23270 [Nocardia neocaledoniensis NBRC 108232]
MDMDEPLDVIAAALVYTDTAGALTRRVREIMETLIPPVHGSESGLDKVATAELERIRIALGHAVTVRERRIQETFDAIVAAVTELDDADSAGGSAIRRAGAD